MGKLERAEQVNAKVVKALGRLRVEQGLSHQELANRAGVTRSYIGLLEKGKRRPTLEVALRLSWALGTTLSSLLAESERRVGSRTKPISRSG